MRQERGVTQKQMADAIGVSAAWLSALENGKRGRPTWDFVQRVIAYFNVIWDEADELRALARTSHPRVVVDTAGLSPKATLLANLVAEHIASLSPGQLDEMIRLVEASLGRSRVP